MTALVGTVIGSFCGYLFNKAQPGGLGLIAMLTTISLGVKFIVRPIKGGSDAEENSSGNKDSRKTVFAMICGVVIGWICGFTGSGGGILMLTVFTLLLGYNLKVAVGTSTMIMTFVALVGTVSHILLGAVIYPAPMTAVVLTCLIGAVTAAKFANKCEIVKLNRVIGAVLLLLGVFTVSVGFI